MNKTSLKQTSHFINAHVRLNVNNEQKIKYFVNLKGFNNTV